MGAAIAWAWAASVGQVWTGTTVFGRPTTVFLRRFPMWLVPGLWMAFQMGSVPIGSMGGEELLVSVLVSPALALFCMATYAGAVGFYRAILAGLASYPLWLSWGFRLMLSGMDLLWRFEAGPGPAAAQAARTNHAVADGEQQNRQRSLMGQVQSSAFAKARLDADVSVRIDGVERSPSDLQVDSEVLTGRLDHERVPVGAVRVVAGGFEVTDLGGRVLLRLDAGGRDDAGRAVLLPENVSAEDWEGAMGEIAAPKGGFLMGPMGHTLLGAVVIAVSCLLVVAVEHLA